VIAAVAEWSFGCFSSGPYSFGFGVSVSELVSGRVVERLLHRCGAFGVDPKRIVIQIATRPLLCQKGARKSVRRLQEAGFRVMLDRFRIEALALLSDPGCSLVRPERVSERDPQGGIRQIATLCAKRSIGVVAPSIDPAQTPESIRQMGATHAFSEQAQEVVALSL
jgi:EAL domain-containing protein (putative c-di-GMP-specific phosphodiesterase class I)